MAYYSVNQAIHEKKCHLNTKFYVYEVWHQQYIQVIWAELLKAWLALTIG